MCFLNAFIIDNQIEMEKTTLIIGASENPGRMANRVIRELRAQGTPVLAIGARPGQVGDVPILTDPAELPGEKVHTVGMYINPGIQPEYYQFIKNLQPERVYFNPGTENPELFQKLREEGINSMNACMMVALTVGTF